MTDDLERHGEYDRRHYTTNGNKPVLSTNDAVRYAILLVAIETFAITVKNNQDASNERQTRMERRIEQLSDKFDQLREAYILTAPPLPKLDSRGRILK